MIHLKIISAIFPPDYKLHNTFIKIIPVHENNTINTYLYKTKKVKKTNNPEWNSEYCIPFYCFDSIILEFWDKKVFGENIIGKGCIQFTTESFIQGEQRTVIKLTNTSSNFQSYCTYSISPVFSSLDYEPSKFESLQVYVYLTYDPPLNPSQKEEVHLYSRSFNKNGSIFEKTFKKEAKKYKMGPSGLTDAYCYNSFAYNEICFYYVKSLNYTGKVTLNIANVPYPADMGDISQYFLFCKDISIPVSSQKDVNFSYSIFPYTFKISNKKVEMKNFQNFTKSINPQKFPINSDQNHEMTNDNFLNAFNYFHSNPEGIALKNILDAGSKEICPSNLTYYYRFNIEPLKRYSIQSAFKFHEIQYEPQKISICFNYGFGHQFTYFVYKSGENGQNLDRLNLDSENFITSKINDIGMDCQDRMIFFISLDKIEKSVKYILFMVTSPKPNVLNDCFIRVVDETSKKELMILDTENSSGQKSVLAAMLVRNDESDWEFWPCMQFITGNSDEEAYEFMSIFLTDKIEKIFR